MNTVVGHIYGDSSWKNWKVSDSNVAPHSGEYAVKIYDQECIVGAVRDPLGLMPLYYWDVPSAEPRLFHTLSAALKWNPHAKVNWEYVFSVWAENFEPNSITPYLGLLRVPPGHLLFRDKNERDGFWKVRPYFKEVQKGSRKDLRETFFEVVSERAKQTSPLALCLSGGFDSSLLASMLASLGYSSKNLSLRFLDGLASEENALQAFEKKTGVEILGINAGQLSADEFKWDPNDRFFYSPNLNLFKPLFKRAKELGVKNVWTGWGADEVFVRDTSLMAALLKDKDVRAFVSYWQTSRKEGVSVSQLLRRVFIEFLPTHLRQKLVRLRPLSLTLDLPEVRRWKTLRRYNRLKRVRANGLENELWERLFFSGSVAFGAEQAQELAQQYGLLLSYPFFDLRLVSIALDFQASDFFQRGLSKYLLRQTFRDLLPDQITEAESHQSYNDWCIEQLGREALNIKAWMHMQKPPVFLEKEASKMMENPWSKRYLLEHQNEWMKVLYGMQMQAQEARNGQANEVFKETPKVQETLHETQA